MSSSSPADHRRSRPALGTLVSIAVSDCSAAVARRAIDRAFARIAAVQRAMSIHDETSEISRLNRQTPGVVMGLSADTYAVLELAQRIARASGGLFDPAIADTLAHHGIIPMRERRGLRSGMLTDVELMTRRQVTLRQSVALDLGGIAKGYAVDVAIEDLRDAGIRSGVVNAGGDLRVFGREAATVHVRHPGQVTTLLPMLQLCESAVATSATYFSRQRSRGTTVGALINPLTRRCVMHTWSVSVVAPSCAVADALTKVVYLAGSAATDVLRKFDATAAILDRRGTVRILAADAA